MSTNIQIIGPPPARPRSMDPLAQEALSLVGGGALGALIGWAIGWPLGRLGGWLLLGSWRCDCGRPGHGPCEVATAALSRRA